MIRNPHIYFARGYPSIGGGKEEVRGQHTWEPVPAGAEGFWSSGGSSGVGGCAGELHCEHDRENPFRSRGFGFVTFSRPEDAESAIQNNHDKEWQVSCVVW